MFRFSHLLILTVLFNFGSAQSLEYSIQEYAPLTFRDPTTVFDSISNYASEISVAVSNGWNFVVEKISSFAFACTDAFNSYNRYFGIGLIVLCITSILLLLAYLEIRHYFRSRTVRTPTLTKFTTLTSLHSDLQGKSVFASPPSSILIGCSSINETQVLRDIIDCRTPSPIPDMLLPTRSLHSSQPHFFTNFEFTAESLMKCSTFVGKINYGFNGSKDSLLPQNEEILQDREPKVKSYKNLFVSYRDMV
ncbi:SKN-1 Dependent Zygotic transcript [Caenorhabditis elegans]|nr:SKN-1 Dependent Zygotic transcript [Caenorhabditis elegans]CAH2662053.1 SKN-1 Dependent Zygotic transcript [Caenorhabditis elegans]